MVKQIQTAQKALDPKRGLHHESAAKTSVNPVVAYRAAQATEQLSASLKKWFNFYNSYDPEFTWWMGMPYEDAQTALTDYQAFLKIKLAGIAEDERVPIIGDPVGREALLSELQDNMIPYTPEELIAIAQTEMDWCKMEIGR